MKITEDEYRELKNEVVLQREILESIQDALDGKEVSDFMMSFGIVRRVCDLTINQHYWRRWDAGKNNRGSKKIFTGCRWNI